MDLLMGGIDVMKHFEFHVHYKKINNNVIIINK